MDNSKSIPLILQELRLQNIQRTVARMVLGGVLIAAAISHAQPAKGANKFLGNITTGGAVRSDFLTYWNQITPENESKWQSVENTRGTFNWAGVDAVKSFAEKNGIPWKFHTFAWGSQYPTWMDALSTADQLTEFTKWMDAAKAKYPDIPMIDVVNEAYEANGGKHAPAPWKAALGGNGTTGYDWIFKAFTMARARWPKAILIYNDYNNCEYGNEVNWTISLINAAKANKIPIDAIGCQAHDAFKVSTSTVKSNIDKLAATGLPIFISEYDIGDKDASGKAIDDAGQQKIMQEQFTMFWNHPKIVGVTYWGYVVGNTWRSGTGLMSASGTERPALTWLKGYVKTNLNPPNDFPNFLSGNTGTISKKTTVQQAAAVFNGKNIQVFDLQGRVSRSFTVNNQSVSVSSGYSAKGNYVVKQDALSAAIINKTE